MSSTGANKEVLKEDEEYLHAEDSEDGEYSDEEECSSQHSVAEYKDVMASGPKADEASGANEEAEKEEPAEIVSKVSVREGGDCMCPAPPCDLQEPEAFKPATKPQQCKPAAKSHTTAVRPKL